MTVDVSLILLRPALIFLTMKTRLRCCPKFTDDQWFLICDLPLGCIGAVRIALIPADIFVESDDVECLTKWIVNDLGAAMRTHQKRGSNKTCRIEPPRAAGKCLNELCACRRV